MIPIQGTAAVLTAPSSPLQTSGYVPGATLAAQIFNWYLYHLTAEINNVLSGQNLSQSTLDDSQLLKAVGRTNVLISTSGTVTTATQFAGNTLVQFANVSGSSNYVIGSGAARPGIELIVEALTGSGVMIVNGSGSAFLGSGAIRLLWDGSAWCKIGGVAFTRVFTSGSAATWITPWKGSYKATVIGGGGGSGGCNSGGGTNYRTTGGGGGGGTSIKTLLEAAGAILTYTVGPGGGTPAGADNDGIPGSSSVLSDGIITLIGGGGVNSTKFSTGVNGGSGGTASGGDFNVQGGPGGGGAAGPSTAIGSGVGGTSTLGGGGYSVSGNSAGVAGGNYGGGASGCAGVSANGNGAAGGYGVIILEF